MNYFQTVETPIRRRILWRLIWICTVLEILQTKMGEMKRNDITKQRPTEKDEGEPSRNTTLERTTVKPLGWKGLNLFLRALSTRQPIYAEWTLLP